MRPAQSSPRGRCRARGRCATLEALGQHDRRVAAAQVRQRLPVALTGAEPQAGAQPVDELRALLRPGADVGEQQQRRIVGPHARVRRGQCAQLPPRQPRLGLASTATASRRTEAGNQPSGAGLLTADPESLRRQLGACRRRGAWRGPAEPSDRLLLHTDESVTGGTPTVPRPGAEGLAQSVIRQEAARLPDAEALARRADPGHSQGAAPDDAGIAPSSSIAGAMRAMAPLWLKPQTAMRDASISGRVEKTSTADLHPCP